MGIEIATNALLDFDQKKINVIGEGIAIASVGFCGVCIKNHTEKYWLEKSKQDAKQARINARNARTKQLCERAKERSEQWRLQKNITQEIERRAARAEKARIQQLYEYAKQRSLQEHKKEMEKIVANIGTERDEIAESYRAGLTDEEIPVLNLIIRTFEQQSSNSKAVPKQSKPKVKNQREPRGYTFDIDDIESSTNNRLDNIGD